jgi:hypothetical protein
MEKQSSSPAQIVQWLRNHKGGAIPKPSGSFADAKFSELVKAIGFREAESLAKYTAGWNDKAPIVLTYKAILNYENSNRPTKIN